ncbi:TIGR02285 family protein [Thalassomonas haliotis]|uniref:TIGR02285 family protein n=1 Tax=Thalassomonas haliotis TaxID=485448 RepID=A0ABY7VIW3_9GAMM|nr:TIGR02285 family protein [Thalassomonas haliotis]WDE13516.1 TIGR02285 family protein [Thalassomonas haliotis]
MSAHFSFALIIYIALALISFASSAQKVTWLTFDFPPYYIVEGPDKDKGRDELIIELIARQLPDYQFEKTRMPSSRVIEAVSKSSNRYCILSIYNTPTRQKQITFTDNFSTLGLAPAIIMSADLKVATSVRNTGVISLAYLLQREYRLGMPSGRSYSVPLDKIITSEQFQQQIHVRYGTDHLQNLFKMMLSGRIHMILGYPDELMYLADELQVREQVMLMKLSEAEAMSKGYIGCSKNDWGEAVIRDLDKAMATVHQQGSYKKILKYWLAEDVSELVDAYLHE